MKKPPEGFDKAGEGRGMTYMVSRTFPVAVSCQLARESGIQVNPARTIAILATTLTAYHEVVTLMMTEPASEVFPLPFADLRQSLRYVPPHSLFVIFQEPLEFCDCGPSGRAELAQQLYSMATNVAFAVA